MHNALLQDTPLAAGQMPYSTQLTQSLNLAAQLAPSLGHNQVIPGHLLLVLLEDSEIAFLLNAHGVNIKEAKTSVLKLFPKITTKSAPNNQTVPVSKGLSIVLNHASESAQKNNLTEISSTFMFATLLREDNAFSRVLESYDLDYEGVAQFLEMQTGSAINIETVPAYTIEDSVFMPPAPTAAVPMAAPTVSPPPPPANANPASAPQNQAQGNQAQAATMASPTPPPSQNPPAIAPKKAGKNKVISFSNILKRQDGDQAAEATPLQSAPVPSQATPNPAALGQPQQKMAQPSPTHAHLQQPIMAPSTEPQQRDVPNPQQAAPQMTNTTFSASGSVIEKGVLIVPEQLSLKLGKPHVIDVRIAPNPQANNTNASYEAIIMEALTTQLHAPGQNFHIKSLLPETHWIDKLTQNEHADYGQWQWEITPLQRGTTKLSLVVSSRTLNKDNQLSSVTLPEKAITVHVGMNSTALIIKLLFLASVMALGLAAYIYLLPRFM